MFFLTCYVIYDMYVSCGFWKCKRCIMGFSREWPLKPRGYLVSCPCVSQLKIVINFSPLYFTGRFTIFKYLPTFCWARAPILFGNDLSGSHLSYSKGFMKFGWPEPPQKWLTFLSFHWSERPPTQLIRVPHNEIVVFLTNFIFFGKTR